MTHLVSLMTICNSGPPTHNNVTSLSRTSQYQVILIRWSPGFLFSQSSNLWIQYPECSMPGTVWDALTFSGQEVYGVGYHSVAIVAWRVIPGQLYLVAAQCPRYHAGRRIRSIRWNSRHSATVSDMASVFVSAMSVSWLSHWPVLWLVSWSVLWLVPWSVSYHS